MHLDQQIAEVGGVERLQPRLIGRVELHAACRWRKLAASPAGTWSGVSPRFFQPSMSRGEHARRPALFVDVLGLQKLLQQPDLVVDVENGEIGLQADQLGMAAQDLHADGMERAEPRHALDDLPDHGADAAPSSRAPPCW